MGPSSQTASGPYLRAKQISRTRTDSFTELANYTRLLEAELAANILRIGPPLFEFLRSKPSIPMTAMRQSWQPTNLPPIFKASILAAALIGCGARNGDKPPSQSEQDAATAPAEDEIAAGKRLLNEGRYDQAIDRLTTALEHSRGRDAFAEANAREAEVYLNRGVAYLKMGFPDTAVEDLTAAIGLAPRHADGHLARARAYAALGDGYKSLRDATEAIRLQPHNADAYQIRGVGYMRRDQYDRAAVDLEQALRENPALATEVQPLLGETYYRWSRQLADASDAPAAVEKLARARELNPQYVDRQLAAEAAKTPAAPTPTAVEQTVAKPILDGAQKQFGDGRAHQLAGRYDQAIIDYTHAIALRPDFDDAFLRRAETLLAMGFPDTALEDLKHVARHGAGSGEAFRVQAQAFLALDNAPRAEMAATDALHVNPSDADAYALRGEAYLRLENWARADADLKEAIRRDPSLKERLQSLVTEAEQGPDKVRQREARREAADKTSPSS